jgi:hypothetical protein
LTLATGALFLGHVSAKFREGFAESDEPAAATARRAGKLVGLLPDLQCQIAEPEMQIHLPESPVSFFHELQ